MKRLASFFVHFGVYVAIVLGILYGLPRFLAWYLETPYPIAAITSGSMWPVLNEGDLVFIEGVSKGELQVGDIVVWRRDKAFTIHRVVRIEGDTYVTKGDANFQEDAPVRFEDIVGRAPKIFGRTARLPYFGVITIYANKS